MSDQSMYDTYSYSYRYVFIYILPGTWYPRSSMIGNIMAVLIFIFKAKNHDISGQKRSNYDTYTNHHLYVPVLVSNTPV